MMINLVPAFFAPSFDNALAVAEHSLPFSILRYGVTGLYMTMLLMVFVFGLHRWMLVYLYYKHKKNTQLCRACFRELPRVTVQLPMFNELYVAERSIAGACALDYPKDKLQIQVLDDSTDRTTEIASAAVARFARQGYDIHYLHRANRRGFKAGALDEGLNSATGRFIAIFDADFLPNPDILIRTIHHFTRDDVGMVQVRWDHINRQHSLLTQSQAILLDAHFMIEHTARNRSGRFMNFNGTAGIWRRSCIEQGGGWQHDTLTEDLDLSYRCQMKGWQFVYLPDITSPAELPPEIIGFKQQQFRWTKGAIQTARKVLPVVFRSSLPFKIKLEAFFHLANPMCYLFMTVLLALLLPVFYLRLSFVPDIKLAQVLFDMSLFMIGSCSASTFYMCSQREIFANWFDKIKYLPFLMSLGVGIALNNARGILQALCHKETDFERTPKFGLDADKTLSAPWQPKAHSFSRKVGLMPFLELAFGLYMTLCIVLCVAQGNALSFSLPFLTIFAVGFYYVGILSLYSAHASLTKPADSPQSSPA